MSRTYAEQLQSQATELDTLLRDWVNQNSFSEARANLELMANRLVQDLGGIGLTVRTHPSASFGPHIVAETPGDRSRGLLVLIGHYDTVFPPGNFEGYTVDGDKRRGPGVLDMKGGIVSMWAALRLLKPKWSQLPVVRCILVSDEEVGSPEGKGVIATEAQGAGAALVFEAGRTNDSIVTRRKGVCFAKFVATGKEAHAGNNHRDGVNAIWALAKAIDYAQSATDYEAGNTVNVGTVRGGTTKNTVPGEAVAELDIRFITKSGFDQVTEQLRQAAVRAGADVTGAKVSFEGTPLRLPMERLEGTGPLLQLYSSCAKAVGLAGEEAPLQGGGSDACTTASLGIPSIDALGPRGTGFHTKDEYIEWQTLLQRAEALALFIEQWTSQTAE